MECSASQRASHSHRIDRLLPAYFLARINTSLDLLVKNSGPLASIGKRMRGILVAKQRSDDPRAGHETTRTPSFLATKQNV